MLSVTSAIVAIVSVIALTFMAFGNRMQDFF